MTLGERITQRRLALGLSQNELARRAGVNHPTLFKIEAGHRLDPSVSIVVLVARALNTTAEALLGLESHPDAAPTASHARKKQRLGAEAKVLAAGGVALVDELKALRKRVETLEAWRRRQEAPARKRAAR